jgi:alanyl-tRNA synthetase
MTPDEAVKLGAMALFGEKYGDEVRVVAMGAPEESSAKSAYSIELCGGTHVGRTGDIGLFRIVAEGAVAAGIRRIEAVAGEAAIEAVADGAKLLAEAAAVLKAPPAELPARIATLQEQNRRLERQVADLQKKLALGAAAADVEDIAGVKFAGRNVGEVAARELKSIATELLKNLGEGIVTLVATADQKASIVVAVSPDMTARFDAVALARAAAAAVGGTGGGGSRTMAQAGGPHGDDWEAALAAVRAALAVETAAR